MPGVFLFPIETQIMASELPLNPPIYAAQPEAHEVQQQIGSAVCLEGNLDPSRVLLQGTPELVLEESRKLISAAGTEGSLILSSGCEVPRDTLPANILAMVHAARECASS
jgi:uroporphyrinogen decarboxylase